MAFTSCRMIGEEEKFPDEMVFSVSGWSNGSGSHDGSAANTTAYTNGNATSEIPDVVFRVYQKFTVDGTGSACGKTAGTYDISEATTHSISASWSGPPTKASSHGSASCTVKFHN